MIFIHRNFSPLLVLDKYALKKGNIINCLRGAVSLPGPPGLTGLLGTFPILNGQGRVIGNCMSGLQRPSVLVSAFLLSS